METNGIERNKGIRDKNQTKRIIKVQFRPYLINLYLKMKVIKRM